MESKGPRFFLTVTQVKSKSESFMPRFQPQGMESMTSDVTANPDDDEHDPKQGIYASMDGGILGETSIQQILLQVKLVALVDLLWLVSGNPPFKRWVLDQGVFLGLFETMDFEFSNSIIHWKRRSHLGERKLIDSKAPWV